MRRGCLYLYLTRTRSLPAMFSILFVLYHFLFVLLSPVHTSCECECEANLDVTNLQRTIRSSCPLLYSLAIIAAKRGCDVKFTSNSLRIRNRSMNRALLIITLLVMSLSCLLSLGGPKDSCKDRSSLNARINYKPVKI